MNNENLYTEAVVEMTKQSEGLIRAEWRTAELRKNAGWGESGDIKQLWKGASCLAEEKWRRTETQWNYCIYKGRKNVLVPQNKLPTPREQNTVMRKLNTKEMNI